MDYMWQMLGLTLIYYVILPVGLIFLVWKIWQKKDELQGISDFGSKKKNAPELKKKIGEMERLQVFLIIFILIFMPVSSLVSYQIQDLSLEYDRMPVGGFGESIEYRQLRGEPLGPSYDSDSIISEMEADDSTWHIEDIREEVDLESLTRLPGALTVYYLDVRATGEEFIVITYNYFSPIPVTRSYVFFVDVDGVFLHPEYGEQTIVYPVSPTYLDPS